MMIIRILEIQAAGDQSAADACWFDQSPIMRFLLLHDEYRNLSLMFPFLYLSAVHTSLHFFGNVATREN